VLFNKYISPHIEKLQIKENIILIFHQTFKMLVLTLHKDRFEEECVNLNKAVLASGFHPELIVSIATGGDYVAQSFNLTPNILFHSIKKQRSSTKVKNKYRWVFGFLKLLPYFFLNFLRKLEHFIQLSKADKNPVDLLSSAEKIKFEYTKSDQKVHKILVVDDAVDSGETLLVVKNFLVNLYPNSEIKTAVIVLTTDNPVCFPDYVLFTNTLIRFPWSNDMKNA